MKRAVALLGVVIALMGASGAGGQTQLVVTPYGEAGGSGGSVGLRVAKPFNVGVSPWVRISRFEYSVSCAAVAGGGCDGPGGASVGAGVDFGAMWSHVGMGMGHLFGTGGGLWWSTYIGVRFGDHQLRPVVDLVLADHKGLDLMKFVRVGVDLRIP